MTTHRPELHLVPEDGVLDAPAAHATLLRRCAVFGLTIGWGTGLLLALQNLEALPFGPTADWALLAVSMPTEKTASLVDDEMRHSVHRGSRSTCG